MYNNRVKEDEMQSLLRGADLSLSRAASGPPLANSTALYDRARIAALLGDGDECRARLQDAAAVDGLPPSGVFRVEPDFSTVRDAKWFKELGTSSRIDSGDIAIDDACYAQLLKSLVGEGFSFKSTNDSLRFPLCEFVHLSSS
jgi:hypothetical protein